MPKMEKRREADFTRKEMTEMVGAKSGTAFDYSMGLACDHYKLDKELFKMDSDTKSGESFFPAEIGELLALLIKAYKSNPAVKATSNGYSAKNIKEYYEEILGNIEELPKEIKDMVYTLPSHFTSNRISIWLERCLPILTNFVVSYMEEKGEDLGALMQRICVDTDKANYCVFFNQYWINLVKESNEKMQEEQYGEMMDILFGPKGTDRDLIQRTLMDQNISVDIELAKLIEYLMLNAEEQKTDIFLDGADEVKKLDRETYYRKFLTQYSNPGDIRLKTETLTRYTKGAKGWKTIEERIVTGEGYAPESIPLTYESEVSELETQIVFMKEKLIHMEEKLEKLKNLSELEKIDRDMKTKEMVDNINKLYVEKCKAVRSANKDLLTGTDQYLGQVLWEFLNKREM